LTKDEVRQASAGSPGSISSWQNCSTEAVCA
jgi:hypothetical protein